VAEARLEYALSEGDSTGPGGMEWGSAVHTVLQAAIQGLDDDALAAVARTALLENDRPVHHGEPTELATLLALVEAVRRSALWERARQAEVLLAEHPFVLEQSDGRYLEGVIDLAFRENGRWVVVDYKTDRLPATPPARQTPADAPHDGAPPSAHAPARREEYRAQVARYGQALAALTGEPVAEARVWYLRGGALVRDES
jgi:ATP-dependent exoDNAse (exonuclease V) beta subunit